MASVWLDPNLTIVEHEKILASESTANDDLFLTIKRVVLKPDGRRYAQLVRLSRYNIDYMFVQTDVLVLHEVAI